MLKGTKEGILIQIRNVEDLIDLEEKIKSKKFFYKDTKFIMSKENLEHFNKVSEILRINGYELYIENENSIEKVNEEKEKQIYIPKPNLKEEKTTIIKKTLRSGQKIEFDGNVIVLGSTNPGSEMIVSGDIYIFGKAMGLLHAGCKGDRNRIIVALKLDVIQIRIADVYAKCEEKYDEKNSFRLAEKAFLDEYGKLIIEEYKPYD